MKKIKTNKIISCVILGNAKTKLSPFLETQEKVEGLPRDLPMKVLYDFQSQIKKAGHVLITGEPSVGEVKVSNCFIYGSGKFLSKSSSTLVLHLEVSSEEYKNLKGRYLVPKAILETQGKELSIQFTRFRALDSSPYLMATKPFVLGEVVKED